MIFSNISRDVNPSDNQMLKKGQEEFRYPIVLYFFKRTFLKIFWLFKNLPKIWHSKMFQRGLNESVGETCSLPIIGKESRLLPPRATWGCDLNWGSAELDSNILSCRLPLAAWGFQPKELFGAEGFVFWGRPREEDASGRWGLKSTSTTTRKTWLARGGWR